MSRHQITPPLPVRRGRTEENHTDHFRMRCNRCEPRQGRGGGGGRKPPLSGCLDENSVLPATSRFWTAGLLSFWDSFWGLKPRHTTLNPHPLSFWRHVPLQPCLQWNAEWSSSLVFSGNTSHVCRAPLCGGTKLSCDVTDTTLK